MSCPGGGAVWIVPAMDTLPRVERAGVRGTARRAVSQMPRRLALAAVVLGALAVVLVAVLVAGTATARGGLSAMASATGEVNATNDLYFRLNDMDAQAADALLVGFHPTLSVPASVDARASVNTYESDRQAADRDVQKIAASPALADAGARLLDALGGYEALIGQAFYVGSNAATQAPAAPPAVALSTYQRASSLMHGSILPIASQITAADSAQVNGQYTADRRDAHTYAAFSIIAGLLLPAGLLFANAYLARRFRRMLAPALAAAAVLTLSVSVPVEAVGRLIV